MFRINRSAGACAVAATAAISILLMLGVQSANAAHVHAVKRVHVHKVVRHAAVLAASRIAVVAVAVKPVAAPVAVPTAAIAPAPVAAVHSAAFGNCGVERDNVEGDNSANEEGECNQIIDFGR